MREKTRKNRVWSSVVMLGFVGLLAVGCSKYDKKPIVGTYNIDLKEALGQQGDFANEKILFNSGGSYKQQYERRTLGKLDESWTIEGKIERKNNKITFSNRMENGTTSLPDQTFKYKLDDKKLTLIIEGEGFKNDEKVYTKETKK